VFENTNVGAILEATDATTFTIINDNGDGFFTISNAGQIQVAQVGLASLLTLSVIN
jgi:hypothetical protein